MRGQNKTLPYKARFNILSTQDRTILLFHNTADLGSIFCLFYRGTTLWLHNTAVPGTTQYSFLNCHRFVQSVFKVCHHYTAGSTVKEGFVVYWFLFKGRQYFHSTEGDNSCTLQYYRTGHYSIDIIPIQEGTILRFTIRTHKALLNRYSVHSGGVYTLTIQ
jgi:hypothetical protein